MSNYALYKFSADWCGPCKIMKNTVNEVIKDFNNIELVSIDVDNNSDLSREYMIRSIPALIIVKKENKKEVGRLIGNFPIDKVRKFISENLKD